MNHKEAVEQMVVERYLLGDLDASTRDDFEEHLFSCPECALDTRVATAFIEEAKAQLPGLTTSQPEVKTGKREKGRSHWFLAWRPAFAAPVFAALAAVICYQNLVTLPALRKAAGEPELIPVAPLSAATRGDVHATIAVDRTHGIAVPIDIPLDTGIGVFIAYSFAIHDPQGNLAWSGTIPAPAQQATASDYALSLVLPGGILKDGSYSVSIAGIGSHSEATPIEQYTFHVTVTQ